MKQKKLFMGLALTGTLFVSNAVQAGEVLALSTQMSAKTIVATGKAVSAVASVPFLITGEVLTATGEASTTVGKGFENEARKGFYISDESIIAGPPPAEALESVR